MYVYDKIHQNNKTKIQKQTTKYTTFINNYNSNNNLSNNLNDSNINTKTVK